MEEEVLHHKVITTHPCHRGEASTEKTPPCDGEMGGEWLMARKL